MDKDERIKTILDSAKVYKEKFLDKKLLIIFKNNQQTAKGESEIQKLEINALASNFQHLTGADKSISPENFFERAIGRKLTVPDIEPKDERYMDLKLSVIDKAMNFTDSSKLYIGNFSDVNSKDLYTEKVLGTREFAYATKSFPICP